jgi:meso-butanediol dehydrogenase / (S,S)-butanediol dehydrogenase / diacetyl reductase
MRLKGKVALVTGAASGIGAATARRLVEDGARVCLTDVNHDLLEQFAGSLLKEAIVTCTGDVTRLEDVKRMVETAVSFGGKLDILVNSAAIDPPGAGEKIDLDLWHKILEVDLTGPFLTMKTAIPYMLKSGGGSIVNIASLAGIRFPPGKTEYSTAKGGLIALTQQMAVQYASSDIRCNVICPGGVRTPMLLSHVQPIAEKLGKDVDWLISRMTANSPLKRIGRPEEIAGICSFLASDDSSLINGNILVADGGASVVDVNTTGMKELFENLLKETQS